MGNTAMSTKRDTTTKAIEFAAAYGMNTSLGSIRAAALRELADDTREKATKAEPVSLHTADYAKIEKRVLAHYAHTGETGKLTRKQRRQAAQQARKAKRDATNK
jgi:hypothetical protein